VTVGDADAILELWELLYNEIGSPSSNNWADHARDWLINHVDDYNGTRISVIEIAGQLVASAIGTVEFGVPNPHSPNGRGVRLANVVTLPDRRGQGYGTAVTQDVIAWARTVGADRIDLSATPDGQHIYERLDFVLTSAPRMKLVL
jgi:GNAT superfamily N-acetyltransferase